LTRRVGHAHCNVITKQLQFYIYEDNKELSRLPIKMLNTDPAPNISPSNAIISEIRYIPVAITVKKIGTAV
jgi:hypothetical protein